MGDPFREGMRRRKREAKERIANSHVPVVLWVRPNRPQADERRFAAEVESYLRDKARELPNLTVPDSYDEPNTVVVVPFHDSPYAPSEALSSGVVAELVDDHDTDADVDADTA